MPYSAAMRLLLQEIEDMCLHHLAPANLQRERVRFEATRKAFNMSASYATSFGSGAREQIQNWWDQCRVMVADRQPAVHPLDSTIIAGVAHRHELAGARAYAACGHGRLLGILLGCTDKTGQQLLFLKNYGAQMTLDNLILGESTKRQDSMLAGQFGEGAKVEINRLVQEGCTVAYCTGNATWTFERAVAPGCTIPELHVAVQPGSDIFDFVSIAIMARSDYSAQLLEEDRFLFLQGSYDKIASAAVPSRKWSGMELLLDPRHHGKVFIHGIFVMDAPTYKEYGINYTGDKSIFRWLGLGRDRNTINDRLLVLGIPQMFENIRHQIGQDEQLVFKYKSDVRKLAMLMRHEGTALLSLVDYAEYNCFRHAQHDQRQLAEALHQCFQEQHPQMLPVCSHGSRALADKEVDDIKYLGFAMVEVPETMYLLFKEANLLPSREQLWEIRKQEILALPDPLQDMSAEQRLAAEKAFHFMRCEVETVFKKYIQPGQIVFRVMPTGNEHAVLGFTSHFVIDANIVCKPDQVHTRLAALWGSDFECQDPCQCPRRLLIESMTEAISRQTGGPSKQRILATVMAEYVLVSRDHSIDLVNATSLPNTPAVSRPSSAAGLPDPAVTHKEGMNSANGRGSADSKPAVFVDPLSGLSKKNPQPLATFVKGERVWYLGKDGSKAAGTVMSVDSGIQPPSYGVHIDMTALDSIRETEGNRLQRMQGSDGVDEGGAATGGTKQNSQDDGCSSQFPQAAVGRPQAVRVVHDRETPVTPGVADPLLFHNGIKAALASVLKHSAGLDCPDGVIRSSSYPSAEGSADTVTVRLCPHTSRHPLRVTNIPLDSCIVKNLQKQLYLPESFDIESWPNAKEVQKAAQALYHLLERLHELIQPGLAPVNMYYDPDDGCIAFNQGNKLWYNAHADHVYAGNTELQGIRHLNWYITVCHELAHNFRHEHDEVFSDYLVNIALQHSREFYSLCGHDHISI